MLWFFPTYFVTFNVCELNFMHNVCCSGVFDKKYSTDIESTNFGLYYIGKCAHTAFITYVFPSEREKYHLWNIMYSMYYTGQYTSRVQSVGMSDSLIGLFIFFSFYSFDGIPPYYSIRLNWIRTITADFRFAYAVPFCQTHRHSCSTVIADLMWSGGKKHKMRQCH